MAKWVHLHRLLCETYLCDIHFPYFETDINILVAFVSNSTSISIFWYPLFRIWDRYQYSGGLYFEFDININILVACVSNSRSISIFWLSKFRVQYRYQYFDGLSFEFKININIQISSISNSISISKSIPDGFDFNIGFNIWF